MREAHDSRYSIHLGSTKMYQDLKTSYRWKDMRRDIAHYVACCDTCSRVKIEHQKPESLLKLLEIPIWKWEDISMDFIVSLPRTPKGNNSIWVIVDRLTKVAHYVPVKITFGTECLANLYVEHILRLHGAPKSIVSNRGPQFVAKFRRSFHKLIEGPIRRLERGECIGADKNSSRRRSKLQQDELARSDPQNHTLRTSSV
jgi:hypothetical protein